MKTFRYLADRHSSWQAWSDFVVVSAIAIANRLGDQGDKRHEEREAEYHSIMKRYTPEEQGIFPQLFALTVMALDENPEQDYLGEMFMALELGNHWKGQFFTPYHLCEFMAKCTLQDVGDRIEQRGWIGIMDCCCGAGALLIAARNNLYLANPPIGYLPPHLHALFVCQDIDRTAALMCYVQLSLLGCAGYVVVGDAFMHPAVFRYGNPVLPIETEGQEIWCMPMFHDHVWVIRQEIAKLDALIRPAATASKTARVLPATEEKTPNEPKVSAIQLTETETGQLTLF